MSELLTTLPLSALLQTRKLPPASSAQIQLALDQFPGLRTGARRGQGLEFDDLRQYQSGDDIRHIDWNVTARTGEPYTRLYREEREHTTTAIVDLRATMFTGSRRLLAVRAGEFAASILWQAMSRGDRCSAVVLSSTGIQATRPASSSRGVLNACELIAGEFQRMRSQVSDRHLPSSGTESIPHATSLAALLEWINLAGRRTGVKLLFSDFSEASSSRWPELLKAAGVRQNLTGVMLTDPLESTGLPAGTYQYLSTRNTAPEVARRSLDSTTGKLLDRHVKNSLARVRASFSRAHIPLLEFDSEQNPTLLLAAVAALHII